ncbi:GntR family transcriptional regulator [Cloacibacillus sp. An23]|uniref:GntR family transcriptional regulator n=1 Tax=Cloacibacillus sp. An23 TaxID=1965591 RepID=UPI0011782577|nr:GntR family transcriptional regulator [Cloacibacillus sp. An23]
MPSPREYIQKVLDRNPFTPLWQAVFSYLKREIITLKLPPGEKLMESRIALELEVSRSPVRRAVEQLVMEGLVETHDGKPQVSTITKKDLQHLAFARFEIDGESAGLAAKRIMKEDLSAMENLLGQFETFHGEEPFYRFAIIDDKFHAIIYKSCGNPYLQSMYAVIRPSLLRYRYYSMTVYPDKEDMLRNTYVCHGAIFHALKNHLSHCAKVEAQQDASRMAETIAVIPNMVNYDIFKTLDNSAIDL